LGPPTPSLQARVSTPHLVPDGGSTLAGRRGGGGSQFGQWDHKVHIFTRDETGLVYVYLPTHLERTLQLYW
jgi:hypothetical protein